MNVQVRPKRSAEQLRRRRPRSRTGAEDRPSLQRQASPLPAPALASPRARSAAPQPGPSQDRLLYNCHCGFVFEAPVSTSVGCPHCGDTQAW